MQEAVEQLEKERTCHEVIGLNFDALLDSSQEDVLECIVNSLATTGLQATQIGRARNLMQRILYQRKTNDKVFLAYTSNLISSGLRDLFAWLARNKLVDAIISTAGGIEEDVIKCLGESVIGSFDLDGRQLRLRGLNRIGNVLVPNNNYCKFEDYFTPILVSIHAAQVASNWSSHTSPSELIYEMGKKLATYCPNTCEQSVLYWCYVHNIPVFSPAITDGSIGDMIYFYNFSKKGMIINPVADVIKLCALSAHHTVSDKYSCQSIQQENIKHQDHELLETTDTTANSDTAAITESNNSCCCNDASIIKSSSNSAIILGGGLPKHFLLTNIVMNCVVSVGTGNEADGCVSSSCIPDDMSAHLLDSTTEIVKVYGDAAYIFPLLMIKCKKQ